MEIRWLLDINMIIFTCSSELFTKLAVNWCNSVFLFTKRHQHVLWSQEKDTFLSNRKKWMTNNSQSVISSIGLFSVDLVLKHKCLDFFLSSKAPIRLMRTSMSKELHQYRVGSCHFMAIYKLTLYQNKQFLCCCFCSFRLFFRTKYQIFLMIHEIVSFTLIKWLVFESNVISSWYCLRWKLCHIFTPIRVFKQMWQQKVMWCIVFTLPLLSSLIAVM